MTRVKICGITALEDAHHAVELGAWALGMIFWPNSPRACPMEQAEAIGAQLHRRVELTGVFVNATLDEVAATADVCRFSLLQLHGDEGPVYCQEAARRTGCRVIKAARVRGAEDVQALRAFRTEFHMMDAHSEKAPGGTGESFDWELARAHPGAPPLILSGGLTPDNVGEAIAAVEPFGVDTASGTEAEPGRKDLEKVSAFFRAVEAADHVAVVGEAAGSASGGATVS
jgi:phosphoribosylanthranilate isomerase